MDTINVSAIFSISLLFFLCFSSDKLLGCVHLVPDLHICMQGTNALAGLQMILIVLRFHCTHISLVKYRVYVAMVGDTILCSRRAIKILWSPLVTQDVWDL